MSDKLTYDELKLGERAKEAYLAGVSPMEINETLPIFLNTRKVYENEDKTVSLTTTDLMIASVLAGLNVWAIGKKGTGKTVVMSDFADFYFGGDIRSGGCSYSTQMGNEFDLARHLLEADQQTGNFKLKGTHKACFFGLDEINHAHAKIQSEAYSFLQGKLRFNGFDEFLGRDGYSLVFATGNDPRDEESSAPFESDGAFVDRFGLIIDLNDPTFSITDSDDRWFNRYVSKTKISKRVTRDISAKIIAASKQIEEESADLGVRAEAAFNFLTQSLSKCPGRKSSTETVTEEQCKKDSIEAGIWPRDSCFDCQRKERTREGKVEKSLCYMINTSNARPKINAKKMASALGYLIQLKNPEAKIDGEDIAFLAYEICGAYQMGILNGPELRETFHNRNHRMMHEVMADAKRVFKNVLGDLYVSQLERARRGIETTCFYKISKTLPDGTKQEGALLPSNKQLTDDEKLAIKINMSGGADKLDHGLDKVTIVEVPPIQEKADDEIAVRPIIDSLDEEISLSKAKAKISNTGN
jgi:hypothetical protein